MIWSVCKTGVKIDKLLCSSETLGWVWLVSAKKSIQQRDMCIIKMLNYVSMNDLGLCKSELLWAKCKSVCEFICEMSRYIVKVHWWKLEVEMSVWLFLVIDLAFLWMESSNICMRLEKSMHAVKMLWYRSLFRDTYRKLNIYICIYCNLVWHTFQNYIMIKNVTIKWLTITIMTRPFKQLALYLATTELARLYDMNGKQIL